MISKVPFSSKMGGISEFHVTVWRLQFCCFLCSELFPFSQIEMTWTLVWVCPHSFIHSPTQLIYWLLLYFRSFVLEFFLSFFSTCKNLGGVIDTRDLKMKLIDSIAFSKMWVSRSTSISEFLWFYGCVCACLLPIAAAAAIIELGTFFYCCIRHESFFF